MSIYGADCPQCGSDDLARERRPGGMTICQDCGYSARSQVWGLSTAWHREDQLTVPVEYTPVTHALPPSGGDYILLNIHTGKEYPVTSYNPKDVGPLYTHWKEMPDE